ncbi:hypothetical protein ACNRDG_06205 [Ralstonia pseudosolanacearum]
MGFIDRHSEWVAALIAGMASGVALAIGWNWTFPRNKDFWDIATAIGTVAAVLVALGIALADGRRKRRESLEAANLAAARVSVAVDESIARLVSAYGWVAFYRDEEQAGMRGFEAFQRSVILAEIDVPSSDLQALVPLPNRCAHRLARAMATLRSLTHNIDLRDDFFATHLATVSQYRDVREECVGKWRTTISEILDLLRVAHREFEAAAQLSAPIPDGVEVHGLPIDDEG